MEKSVFITGATVNTGLGIAEKFAKEGYNLFLGSRNAENAEKTAKELWNWRRPQSECLELRYEI